LLFFLQIWGSEINPQHAWKKFVFTFTGVNLVGNLAACPKTAAVLNKIPNLLGAEFSILPAGRVIAAHSNCVFPEMIRSHLVRSV
jgi:aspartyl/asparaginyl beta-hydroxylase (cupin superfamily)